MWFDIGLLIRNYVPWLAVVSSVVIYATGSKTCFQIIKHKTTGEVVLAPFVASLYNGVIMLKYALMVNIKQLIIVCGINTVCQITYITIYYMYAQNKRKCQRLLGLALPILYSILIYSKYFASSEEAAISTLGILGAASGILMTASPLVALSQVVKTKSTKSLDFSFILANFISCFLWTITGFSLKDPVVIAPNGSGIFLTSFQLSLFIYYPSKSQSTADKEKMVRLFGKLENSVKCEAPLYNYAVKRADPRDLQTVFYKYASVEEDGVRYITPTDLIRDLLQMDAACFNETTLKLFAGVVDQSKDGLITFEEFQAFEALLCNVDAKYRVVFQMFDLSGKGKLTFEEFKRILDSQVHSKKYPFNYDSEFVTNLFGPNKTGEINYQGFTQIVKDLNKEYVKHLFQLKANGSDHISLLQFNEIMKIGCGHKLTQYIAENMMTAVTSQTGGRQVSYVYCLAFYDMLENMETFSQIFKQATDNRKFSELTKEELLQASQRHSQVTPLQVEILFDICTVSHPGKGKVSLIDTFKLIPKIDPLTVFSKIHEFKHYERSEKNEEKNEQTVVMHVVESAYKFSLGSVAGACGAAAVYPIDLVKTRMQNQRSVLATEVLYKNSFDCFRKVIVNEGPLGLYRGLIPQLIGVSPEKAIKLTTNDLVRAQFTDKDGEIRLVGEILAGGSGGAAQVMFTNPIEIVKIRMQVAGESGHRPGALQLVKELGFSGLYKGARACFLRDIPFSAIYFPCYANLKLSSADVNGYNSPFSLLTSAAAAGVPAAYLVTPADVIKTRLQVKAKRGQQTYRGVMDCARKIYMEEGASAFFKGGPARIFRSSPQFGVTLLVYEMLQRSLYIDFGGGYTETELTPVNPEVSLHPDHIGGLRLAVASFSGIETKFGLMLPKFNTAPKKVDVKS